MKMLAFSTKVLRDERGLAAEFALVVPLFLIFLLGTIDVGIYAWRINQAEKATQIGARWAAVTDPVAAGLNNISMVNQTVGTTLILQGDRIPAMDFKVSCTSTACSCAGTDCVTLGTFTHDNSAFSNLSREMTEVYGAIEDANISIDYSGSGLGFAGDPNGPDVVPVITVRLVNMQYTPVTLSPIGTTVNLPDFAYSITAEDATGSVSN